MKTLVKFNKGNEQVTVSTSELLDRSYTDEMKEYLGQVLEYETFCKNQTKRGQARKNERAKARHRILNGTFSEKTHKNIELLKKEIFNEKDSLIEKIAVEVEYDGRKKSDLSRIIAGVRMAIFTGGLSPQYYGVGLIDFQIVK